MNPSTSGGNRQSKSFDGCRSLDGSMAEQTNPNGYTVTTRTPTILPRPQFHYTETTTTRSHRSLDFDNADMRIQEREELGGQTGRHRVFNTSVSRAAHFENDFYSNEGDWGTRRGRDPRSILQVDHPPPRRVSSEGPDSRSTNASSVNSNPEDILHLMSQTEKDRLLRQFLSAQGQKLRRLKRQEDGKVPRPKNNTHMSAKQMDVLAAQAELLHSYEREKEATRIKDLDEEAIAVGIRESQRVFREQRRRQDEEEMMENAMVEIVKLSSLRYSHPWFRNENIVEGVEPGSDFRAQRGGSSASTASMNKEHVNEEVTRGTLAGPPLISQEPHLLSQEHLLIENAHYQYRRVLAENNRERRDVPLSPRPNGDPSTGDETPAQTLVSGAVSGVARSMRVEEADDDSFSHMSDRKAPFPLPGKYRTRKNG